MGVPLGDHLDGVPVAVKDSFHVAGYPTAGGTSFLRGGAPQAEDALLVARWRELGALIVGKTTMCECGTSPLGDNSHYGHARNPMNAAHLTGGSSSGSAAAVPESLRSTMSAKSDRAACSRHRWRDGFSGSTLER